jgi:hypothetical protein
MHVEQVLGDVPPSERCRCHEERAKDASPATGMDLRSRIRALFGK